MVYEDEEIPDLRSADIVLVGCNETRGAGQIPSGISGPDAIRREFYSLYQWHSDVNLVDVGNIIIGASLNDTYAALKTVLAELTDAGKTVVVLGGSHDLTLAQYHCYTSRNYIIEATCVDSLIDLSMESRHRSENFLMEMLTGGSQFYKTL